MRQQLLDPAAPVRGQAREHVLQVGIGVMTVHARRLHQAHHRRRPLARTQAAGEQPVVSSHRDRPDLVLDPVVVHGQLPVINEARQRSPTPQAVIQRLGRGRTVRQLLPLQPHPLVQCIEQRLGVLLPDGLALIGAQLPGLAFDVVDLGELLQREAGELAFVRCMQVAELAPGVCQAAHLSHAAGDHGLVAGRSRRRPARPCTGPGSGAYARPPWTHRSRTPRLSCLRRRRGRRPRGRPGALRPCQA